MRAPSPCAWISIQILDLQGRCQCFTSLLVSAAAFMSRSETYPLIQWGNAMTVIGAGLEPALGIGVYQLMLFVYC